jgi:hypothetical protein
LPHAPTLAASRTSAAPGGLPLAGKVMLAARPPLTSRTMTAWLPPFK